MGFEIQNIIGVEDTCCPHQVCVPVEKECQELVEPECGNFQQVKTTNGADGCPRYVCECITTCPSLAPGSDSLLPGESYETVTSGCCPSVVKKCSPELCPAEEACASHLVRTLDKDTKDHCCPVHTCEMPTDKCLYSMKNENAGELIVLSLIHI